MEDEKMCKLKYVIGENYFQRKLWVAKIMVR